MAIVTVEDTNLVVEMSGWQVVWALRRKIVVPLAHVVSAQAGDGVRKWPYGIRLGGTYLPKVITAGNYWKKGAGWEFWSVRNKAKAIEIVLKEERYRRLVVEVEDPDATVAMIQTAIRPYQ